MQIHVTDLRQFRDCRMKWWLSSPLENNLRPNIPASARLVGSLFHVGVAQFHKTFAVRISIEEASEAGMDAMLEYFGNTIESAHFKYSSKTQSTTSADDLDLAVAMYENFCMWYGYYELLEAEIPLRMNIPTPRGTHSKCVLLGTADGLVKYRNQLWGLEVKTSASRVTGTEKELLIDFQQQAYVMMMRSAGYDVVGMLRLIAVKKLPRMPKLTKRGKLSRQKITTTYEHVMKAIESYELDPNDYNEWLDELMGQEHPCFMLYEFKMTKKQIDRFQGEAYRTYRALAQHKKHMYRNETMWCRRCSYSDICRDIAVGNDPSWRIEEYFHQSDFGK